jgi:hypothetical protein
VQQTQLEISSSSSSSEYDEDKVIEMDETTREIERDGFDRLEDITFREQVEEEAKSQSEKVKYGSPSSIGECIRIEDIDTLRLPKALALSGQMKVLK